MSAAGAPRSVPPTVDGTGGGDLAGIVVGIPAARRAREHAALVERRGGSALVGPVVEEVAVPDDDPALLAATREAASAAPRWSVHLTGAGTRRWFVWAAAHGLLPSLLEALRGASVVARGGKAARALGRYGVVPAWAPPAETSAEIAGWLRPRVAHGDVVVLQRHGEPSPALEAALRDAGARILPVVTYRWAIPADRSPAEALVRALVSGQVHALAVTSAPQVRHLLVVAGSLGVEEALRAALRDRVYVGAVGTVAAEALARESVEADVVASPARMGALVRTLAAARAEILRRHGR